MKSYVKEFVVIWAALMVAQVINIGVQADEIDTGYVEISSGYVKAVDERWV